MSRAVRAAGIALAACFSARGAAAQIAELHMGPLASYGTGTVYGPGGGVVVGLAAGRLTYVGARYAWFSGTTVSDVPPPALCTTCTRDVRSRAQMFAVDFGLLIPKGPVEVIPSVTIGVLRFAQRERLLAASNGSEISRSRHSAVEFLIAPGIALEMRAGGFAIIPEILWSLAGKPDLPYAAKNQGPLVTLRVVRMIEIGRVRR